MPSASDTSKETLVFAGIALASDKHILKGEEGNFELHGLPPYSLTAMFKKAGAIKCEFGLAEWKVHACLNDPQKGREHISQEELQIAAKSLIQASRIFLRTL